ncbi:aldehyde dehydrogenase [Patulibacter sp. S7RM1-6]
MSTIDDLRAAPALTHPTSLYLDGAWVAPSTAETFAVVDATTEQPFYAVAAAGAPDVARAVAAARRAFDEGPWPRLSHAERGSWLRALGDAFGEDADEAARMWPRESGALHATARARAGGLPGVYASYADLAATYPFEEEAAPTAGAYGLLVREPVGVVAAIIPWNAPMGTIAHKVAPALLAGCTVVLKAAPEAPGAAYQLAEAAARIGLPAGVLNVLTADRDVSELLVRDPGVDKISFTGSTAAGRRIGALAAERVARCTLELGGKSAAVILDDYDVALAARTLARAECHLAGQACSSLTRIVVPRASHDALVEALVAEFEAVRVGDPFDPDADMGPLATSAQRDRVEGHLARAVADGAVLATGGGRPRGLDRGWFVEPTVVTGVTNDAAIAREEVFGPVLTVLAADDEDHAVRIANDSIFGLNASVFTEDVDRARAVAGRLRSGTVGHNAFRTDFGMAFGGFKQSGIGREGGREGLAAYLETKAVILDQVPSEG